MKNIMTLIAAPILAFSMSFAIADDSAERSNPIKDLVQEHMLASGYITEADIEARAAEKAELKAMIEELKEAGDYEGAKALREEAKLAQEEKRESVQAYIAENADLSEAIEALVEELKAERAAARAERKASRGL